VRISIVQMPMSWAPEENTRSVLEHLAEAKALAADLVLFPECATTGYHRDVPELISRDTLCEALERIQAQCAALELAAVVGSPFFPSSEDERIWNAAIAIDAVGQIQAICPKMGLTQSECRFFHPGDTRPLFTLGTVPCSVILCREVRDAELLRSQLPETRLLVWPGVIAWDSEAGQPDNVVTKEIACGCAHTLNAHLVQCNWASSQNRLEQRGMGGSLVISPQGEVLHECPRDEAGIYLVDVRLSKHSVDPQRSRCSTWA